jgi:hypothetical protein
MTLGNPGVEVEVRGVYNTEQDTPEWGWVTRGNMGELLGANLWQTPDLSRRTKETDVIGPGNAQTQGYILLNNGDRVRILGGTADHYRVDIVTNQADNDVEGVKGKEGWIWRQFVDGNQGGE